MYLPPSVVVFLFLDYKIKNTFKDRTYFILVFTQFSSMKNVTVFYITKNALDSDTVRYLFVTTHT